MTSASHVRNGFNNVNSYSIYYTNVDCVSVTLEQPTASNFSRPKADQ